MAWVWATFWVACASLVACILADCTAPVFVLLVAVLPLLLLPADVAIAIMAMITPKRTSDPQPIAKNLPLVRFFGAGGGTPGYDG